MNGSGIFNLLAVAAGGYLFCTKCYLLKYKVDRESGHKLYITNLAVGFAIAPLALGLRQLGYTACNITDPWCVTISRVSHDYLFAFLMLLSGFTAAAFINKLPHLKMQALIAAFKRDEFDSFCYRAMSDFKPIALTLDTRKVYVGIIVESQKPGSPVINFLPLYSGYRSSGPLAFTLTNDYSTEFKSYLAGERELFDLSITVPKDRIVSIHIYNDHIYRKMKLNHHVQQ